MTKEEARLSVMGAISMALKDPILQQGFEIICKENAELKETCNKWFEHLKNREEELLNELYNQNAKYEKRIADLEKENAELKAKYDTCLRENTGLKIHDAYVEKKLTKAKEIIQMLLSSKTDFDEKRFALWAWKEEVNKAEQFLNSEAGK